MSLKSSLKKIRDDYVRNQVRKAQIPELAEAPVCRRKVVFSGRVQKIGFRLEVCELAMRLGLTGFCRNLENGDVLAELQGPQEKIQYLVSFMESLKRIKIREKTVEEMEVVSGETGFFRL